ncbi:MAG: RHS repeat-associated core domain-containing protein, partial [Fibromonadaceae bacterium]|nr:RHS repeat-associated core domain-containing protein [Fibromonadaceae bacterium]
TYDPVGNITEIRDDAQDVVFFFFFFVNPSQTFEYDALYRLTKATGREHAGNEADTDFEKDGYPNAHTSIPNDTAALRRYTREWEYDEVGNILNLIHKANSSVVWNRAYNYATGNNRLLSTEVGSSPAVNYVYNEHGSMTEMPHLQNMEWDFAERLRHITKGTTEAYYNYDGSGERVRKVVEKGNIVETRLYLGSFEIFRKKDSTGSLILERETLHIMDDKKRIALVETKTYENGQIANPAIVQRYQLSNNIESATLELDGTASIISYEEYYPYGDTSYQAGNGASEVSQKRYRYTGKEKDEESGLYYMLARYYSGWLGRWTAVDPMASKLPHQSSYIYCSGNPINRLDPDGMFDMETEAGVGIIEWGDTLSGIRDKINEEFGTDLTVEDIAADNAIEDSNKIYAGNKIYLPNIEKDSKAEDVKKNTKNIVRNDVESNNQQGNFSNLVKEAYKEGLSILKDPNVVFGLKQLQEKAANPEKIEYYFTAHVGKTNIKIVEGIKHSVGTDYKYDDDDKFMAHVHTDEGPLSLAFERDFYENEERPISDLGHSVHKYIRKGVLAITPSGHIYYTTPELAEHGVKQYDEVLGQVHLGNIKKYQNKGKRK